MNKYDSQIRDRVIELRGGGYTFREIQQELGEIPKGTLSYMCRNVKLDAGYKEKIRDLNLNALQSAREKATVVKAEITRRRLIAAQSEAERIVNSTRQADLQKVALAMLYLGEGRKRASFRGLSLGGSDKDTLRIYLKLLEECYQITSQEVKAAVQYRADQDVDELIDYWASALGLQKMQFYNTKPDARTLGKPTQKQEYKGVCVITCRGANIQLELSLIAKQYAGKLWGYSSAD